MSEQIQRWTIYRPPGYEVPGTGEVWEAETHVVPDLEPGEEIEVMPVAEHEKLRAEIESALPKVYDGMHLVDCPYVAVLSRVQKILEGNR
jgi:hypothetical protein